MVIYLVGCYFTVKLLACRDFAIFYILTVFFVVYWVCCNLGVTAVCCSRGVMVTETLFEVFGSLMGAREPSVSFRFL